MRHDRFVLERVDGAGVPFPLKVSAAPEDVLRRRDELMDERVHIAGRRGVFYFVLDRENLDCGEVEWCDECPSLRASGGVGAQCVHHRRLAALRRRTAA